MDHHNATPGQPHGTGGPPRKHIYAAHGPWPIVLAVLLFLKFFWCIKLCYSVARGDLDGTPAEKAFTSIYLDAVCALMDVLMFPGFDLYSYLRNEPWPPGPALFFAQSFIYAILNSTSGIVAFLWLHRKAPRAMDPGTPGYDTAAAREYGGWRSVDMPLYATLCIITAVLIVVNCAAWLRWDLERKRLAARAADVELRDMRLRRMFQMGGAEGREEKTVLGAEPSREGGQRGRMSE